MHNFISLLVIFLISFLSIKDATAVPPGKSVEFLGGGAGKVCQHQKISALLM
jgi:hypothetical protein